MALKLSSSRRARRKSDFVSASDLWKRAMTFVGLWDWVGVHAVIPAFYAHISFGFIDYDFGVIAPSH